MERFVLRVLVVILLGTTLGFWGMAHSKVMWKLPENPGLTHTPPTPAPKQAPTGPTGPTGSTAVTGGQVAPTGKPEIKPTAAAPSDAASDYFISLEQAKQMWDTKKYGDKDVIFVDAREYVEYQEGHIAGAMSCPKRRFDGAAPKYVRNYLPGNAVVVYCHGQDCTDSEAVVKRLIALNLNIGPLFIIKDGIPGWEKAGYPINKGDSEGFVN